MVFWSYIVYCFNSWRVERNVKSSAMQNKKYSEKKKLHTVKENSAVLEALNCTIQEYIPFSLRLQK
jgi:hypothetical protein